MNKEILELMEERRKLKNKEAHYKKLNKTIKIKCNEAKEKWINVPFHQTIGIDFKQFNLTCAPIVGRLSTRWHLCCRLSHMMHMGTVDAAGTS